MALSVARPLIGLFRMNRGMATEGISHNELALFRRTAGIRTTKLMQTV